VQGHNYWKLKPQYGNPIRLFGVAAQQDKEYNFEMVAVRHTNVDQSEVFEGDDERHEKHEHGDL